MFLLLFCRLLYCDTRTMEETACDPEHHRSFIHHNNITALSFHPKADRFIASSLEKTLRLWKLDVQNLSSQSFEAHENDILDVCYSSDGALVASASKDTSVRIWVPEVGHSFNFRAHSSDVRSVQFSPDGEKVSKKSTFNYI